MSATHRSVWIFFACWKYSWHYWGGGVGVWGRRVFCISFFVFSFKPEDTTTWEVTWESKLLGLDSIAGVFVQNVTGLLALGPCPPSHHWACKFFPGGCGARHVVALFLFKELWTLFKPTTSIQENVHSSSLPSLKLKSLTVVPSLLSDPWLVFCLLSLDIMWVTAISEAELPVLDFFTIPRQTHPMYYNTTELQSKTCINLLERKSRWIYFALLLYSRTVFCTECSVPTYFFHKAIASLCLQGVKEKYW